MAHKTFEEKLEDWKAEAEASQVEAPAETEQVEQEPAQEPETEQAAAAEPEPETEAPADPAPESEPAHEPEHEPKNDVLDEIENTNSIIRRRLEKQAAKFEEEKRKITEEFEARIKALEEQNKPKPEIKTRDSFQTDEEYVAYLTRQQINADREEQLKLQAEKDAEDAKAKAEQAQVEEATQKRQKLFLDNVDECFEDKDSKAKFLSQVQYATKKGLGDLLDSCPVACDYLLYSRKGPKVLNKILNDRDTFLKVFDPRGTSPFEQFSALKEVERSLEAPAVEEPAPAPVQAPKLGRPGAQGSGGGVKPLDDPKSRRDYVRQVMGY